MEEILDEKCNCTFCGIENNNKGTGLCNNCWEITHRMKMVIDFDPMTAIKLLKYLINYFIGNVNLGRVGLRLASIEARKVILNNQKTKE